jgi:hypothetical protein
MRRKLNKPVRDEKKGGEQFSILYVPPQSSGGEVRTGFDGQHEDKAIEEESILIYDHNSI